MSLYKRPNSKTWYYNVTVDGKRYNASTGLENKKDAQAWVEQRVAELKAARSLAAFDAMRRDRLSQMPRTKIEQAVDRFLSLPKRRKSPGGKQLAQIRSHWRDFCGYLADQGVKLVSEISEAHAREYIQHLSQHGRYNRDVTFRTGSGRKSKAHKSPKNLSQRTVNVYHKNLGYVCRVLFKEGYAQSPFDFEHAPDDSIRRETFTQAEIEKLREAADPFNLAILLAGLLTGKRRNEICDWRWDEVHMEGPPETWTTLQCREDLRADGTKRKTTGCVPIVGRLREFIEERRRVRDDMLQQPELSDEERELYQTYVLPEHHKQLKSCQKKLTQDFCQLCEDHGITTQKHIEGRDKPVCIKGIHSLRHTFIFELARQGVPVEVTMGMVGHLSPDVHQIYRNHFNHADRRAALSAVENPFDRSRIDLSAQATPVQVAEQSGNTIDLDSMSKEEMLRLAQELLKKATS